MKYAKFLMLPIKIVIFFIYENFFTKLYPCFFMDILSKTPSKIRLGFLQVRLINRAFPLGKVYLNLSLYKNKNSKNTRSERYEKNSPLFDPGFA